MVSLMFCFYKDMSIKQESRASMNYEIQDMQQVRKTLMFGGSAYYSGRRLIARA